MVDGQPPESLWNLPLLAQLDAATREKMATGGFMRRVPRGALIFTEGEAAQGLWALLEGRIKLVRTSPQGKELLVHLVEPGQTFAEAVLFESSVYPATAVALEKAVLWHWPTDQLRSLLADDPDLAMALLASLARWTRRILMKLDLLTQRRVEERLALYLLARHRGELLEPGAAVHLEHSKRLIAAMLGTGPEVFSRTIRHLEDEGIIESRPDRIIIRDPNALRTLAAGLER